MRSHAGGAALMGHAQDPLSVTRTTRLIARCAGGLLTLGLVTSVSAAGAVRTKGHHPGYLEPWTDPATQVRIVRITGDAGTGFAVGRARGTWGTDARHHYSRDQPWNADGTLLAVENRGGGSPASLLLDGDTYEPLTARCDKFTLNDFRWHPSASHARIQIGVREASDSLVWLDPIACRIERGWKLPLSPKGIGFNEGNPSNDGRFLALANQDSIVIVDMDPQTPHASYASGNRRIGPVYVLPPCSLDVARPAQCRVGNISISASGRYVDVKFGGVSGDSAAEAHRIYEVDPVSLAIRPHAMAATSLRCGSFQARPNGWIFPLKHADLALDPSDRNEDVIVGARSCPGSRLGRVVKVRLRDGAVTELTDPRNEASPWHVSTRNLDRPGWVYVTYMTVPGKRQSGEIVAVKLDGSKTIERIARHRTIKSGRYRAEAHAVPSRDGRRVLFASNWAEDCPECAPRIEAFIADTRSKPGGGRGPR